MTSDASEQAPSTGKDAAEIIEASDYAFTVCTCGRGILSHRNRPEWWHADARLHIGHLAYPRVTAPATTEGANDA